MRVRDAGGSCAAADGTFRVRTSFTDNAGHNCGSFDTADGTFHAARTVEP